MLKTLLPEDLQTVATKAIRQLVLDIDAVKKIIDDEISKKSDSDRLSLLKSLTYKDIQTFSICLGTTIALDVGLCCDFFSTLVREGDGVAGAGYIIISGLFTLGTLRAIASAFDFYHQPLTTLSASTTKKVNQLVDLMEKSCELPKSTINPAKSISHFLSQLDDVRVAAKGQLLKRQEQAENESQRLQILSSDLQKTGMFTQQLQSNKKAWPNQPAVAKIGRQKR